MVSFEDDDPIEGRQPCHLYPGKADKQKGRVTSRKMKTRTWTTTIMTTKKEKIKTKGKERKKATTMTTTTIKTMRATKTTTMKEMQMARQNRLHSRAGRVERLPQHHDRRTPPLC
jgi:hypothetical protein